MTLTVEAVYENGVLKPTQPLPLKEQEKVSGRRSADSRRTTSSASWSPHDL